jgi:hypothetical protein
MSDVIDVLNAFGTPLKLAWVGWIAWGMGQYFWFRHERSVPAKRVTARPAAKTAAPAKAARAEASETPVIGRLITPSHVAAEAKPRPVVSARPEPLPEPIPAPMSAPLPMAVPATVDASVPVFDPSTAVIEQFGPTADNVLDKFVRDFEMQDARPRRRRTPQPGAPSYGAEAPLQ